MSSGKEQRRCRCAAPSASPAHFCACFFASGEAQGGQPLNQPANLAPEWSGSEIHLSVPQISPQSAGLNGLLRVHPCVHARVRVSTGFRQDGGNTPRWEMHPTRFPAVPDTESGAGLRFRTQPPGCRCPLLSPQPLRQDPGQQPRGGGRGTGTGAGARPRLRRAPAPANRGDALAVRARPLPRTCRGHPASPPLHPRPTRDRSYVGGCRGARGAPGCRAPGAATLERGELWFRVQEGTGFSTVRGFLPKLLLSGAAFLDRDLGETPTHTLLSPPPPAWPQPGHRRVPLGKGPAGTGIARRGWGWVFFVGWGAAHTCTRDSVRPMRKASSSRMKMSG